MGGKSKSRNAFYYFMLDFKQKNANKFKDMKEVADAANPHWQKMNTEERRPFEEKAKSDKQNKSTIKYTSTGVNIEVMKRREEALLIKVREMQDNISETITKAVEGDTIGELPFFVIHINHYGYCNTTRQYIPAEIAVAQFTLKYGVTPDNVYHSIIYPGDLPVGYAFQAIKVSGETHQIAPGLQGESSNNLKEVIVEFMSFLRRLSGGNNKIPPIYVEENNKDCVEGLLKIFCLDYGYHEDYLRIYSLEYLFYTLRNAVGDAAQPEFPSIAVAKIILEKDIYDFCKDIPCSYHINSDVPHHCSRSHVIRVAYIICDNCCKDLDIDLIAGQHVPSDAKIAPKRCMSSASSYCSTSTVKQGAIRKNFGPKADNYFLSQRTESEMSEISGMSETNSVYGCDTENNSQADTDDWVQPRQRHKRRNHSQNTGGWNVTSTSASEFTKPNRGRRRQQTNLDSDFARLSVQQQGAAASGSASDLHFTSPSGDEGSQPTFSRRPAKLSAVFTGGITSQSSGSDFSKNVFPIARGRGRGLAAHLPKQN